MKRGIERLLESLDLRKGLIIIFAVGLLGHVFELTRPVMLVMTPYALIATGLVAIWPLLLEANARVVVWMALSGAVAFAVEVLGIKSGAIFGDYSYGAVLGVKLWEVPLVIAWNWMMVFLGSAVLASVLVRQKPLIVILGTALTLALDLAMEPVAIRLGYWSWGSAGVPLQNYLVWSGLSAVSLLVYVLLGCRQRSRLPAVYFALLLAYFAVLNVVL